MRRAKRISVRPALPFPSGSSYEHRILETLATIDTFCERQDIPYALFGGAGVAAYLGHLPRKIHDVDLLLIEENIPRFKRFLRDSGFVHRRTYKSTQARFLKYIRENHLYQQVVTIFPGRFTLLNLTDSDLRPLEVFDFEESVRHAEKRSIRTLRKIRQETRVRVLPIEDLLISKLWPVIEPTTIHDSFFLLSAVIAKEEVSFDWDYFSSRLRRTKFIKELCRDTFSELIDLYHLTVWGRNSTDTSEFDCLVSTLKTAIAEAIDPKARSESDAFVHPPNVPERSQWKYRS